MSNLLRQKGLGDQDSQQLVVPHCKQAQARVAEVCSRKGEEALYQELQTLEARGAKEQET